MKAKEKEGLLTYHQKLIVTRIQKEFALIRSTTSQGTNGEPSSNSLIPSFLLNLTFFLDLVSTCSYSSMRAYGQSKLCNILHANELAKQLKVTRKNKRVYQIKNICF